MNGYTQQNIADILAVNRSTYSYYEIGKTQPNIETLQKLASLYQIDLSGILNGNIDSLIDCGKRPKKRIKENPQNVIELSSLEKSLIAQLRVLGKEDILLLIDELKKKITK